MEVVDLQTGYNGMAVVYDVSFSVREGEVLVIPGSNGSGKITTLRAITGTIEPMSGIIRYKGEDITGTPSSKLVSKGIVMAPEGRMLFGGMMVEDNLLMGAHLNQDKKAVQEHLKLVYELLPKVEERKKQTVSTPSGSEQRMVTAVRGLMSDPKLLILDEPPLGLMRKPVQEIFKFIEEIVAIGITVIIVERNVVDTPALCDYVSVIQNGESIIEGRREDLLSNEDVKWAYLGG